MQRGHRAEPGLVSGVDRRQTEPGCEHPVVRRRRATALDVAEHGRARLLAGACRYLLLEPLPDALESHMAERVPLPLLDRHAALDRRRALGDNDDRRVMGAVAMLDVVAHF